MSHVVLLGDSIFDNASYVAGGPAVIDHLTRSLPAGWTATLRAVDGAVVADILAQVKRLPVGATHLVVSVGGNDALGHRHLMLSDSPATFAKVMDRLGQIRDGFRLAYRGTLDRVRAAALPATVCTVYDAVPLLNSAARAGLAVFNEVILGEAARAGVPVIDLRLVCPEAADYSPLSPIEPSAAGGAKIARAIVRAVTGHDFAAGGCRVYT
jgi:hypothetical protein